MSGNSPSAIPRQTPSTSSRNSSPLLITPTATSGTTVSLLTTCAGISRSIATMTSVFAVGDPNYAGQDVSMGAVI
eukprot:4081680-Ditylum_brightwellii.AAC.1